MKKAPVDGMEMGRPIAPGSEQACAETAEYLAMIASDPGGDARAKQAIAASCENRRRADKSSRPVARPLTSANATSNIVSNTLKIDRQM